MSWKHVVASVVPSVIASALLAAKWELGVRRVGTAVLGLSGLWTLVVASLGKPRSSIGLLRVSGVWMMTAVSALGFLAYRFYRDPERVIPLGDNVILSPADGTVLYVRESLNGMIPISEKNGRSCSLRELTKTPFASEHALVIGIAMNFLDVHVNRAPIEGQVTLQRHFPGSFLSLKHPRALTENERATTIFERDGIQVAVVQTASRLVRQIVSFVREGERVSAGQRIGVIRFGSQVDLILPKRDDLQLRIEPGQHVTAGETIVAELTTPSSTILDEATTVDRRHPIY